MPRTSSGPQLKWNPRRHVYEIRWTERSQTDSGRTRSRRLSTGTADLQEAQRVFAGWLSEFDADPDQPQARA